MRPLGKKIQKRYERVLKQNTHPRKAENLKQQAGTVMHKVIGVTRPLFLLLFLLFLTGQVYTCSLSDRTNAVLKLHLNQPLKQHA